jgi:transposase
MIGLGTAALKIYVALEPQDMRKSFQGLGELALAHLGGKLERDSLFVFTNRRRRLLVKSSAAPESGSSPSCERAISESPLKLLSMSQGSSAT